MEQTNLIPPAQQPKSGRVIYLDCLRIFAAFAVVMIHTCALKWHAVEYTSPKFFAFNLYDAGVRWAVPVFIMISGAFLLDNSKPLTLAKLYKKQMFRILTALIFWSLAYAVYYSVRGGETSRQFWERFLYGHFHLWYLYMLIGLYIIAPLLRKITADTKATRYFLLVAFVLTLLIPDLLQIPALSILTNTYRKLNYHFTMGHVIYFVLGYYLTHTEIPKKYNKWIYLGGIIGYFTIMLGTLHLAQVHGDQTDQLYNIISVPVFLEATAVMVFFKNRKFNMSERMQSLVFKLSKYSFGVYLCHIFVRNAFNSHGIHTAVGNAYITVPVLCVAVFLISYVISFVLNQIPIVKKYLV